MLSKFLYGIGNVADLVVLASFFVNPIFLWFPIINSIIINYLVFSFKNMRIHIINIVVTLTQILLLVYINLEDRISANITLILLLTYMINNIVYYKRENKSIFYTICIILILFVIRMISGIVIYGSCRDGILPYCSFIFGLTLLISNIYISNTHLTNKYLKYTTLLINIAYVTIIICCFFSFALNPDIGSL